jgi:predicted dehydrogenase
VSRPVAVGLVGCGRVAERGYLPALEVSATLRLAGVADPAADRRAHVAPSVPGFDDVETLLSSVALELVVVATPPGLHEALAAAAAAAGVPSLVEKPPALDARGASALAALDPAPWIGFNRRFDPAVGSLRDAVGGESATVVDVELSIAPARWAAFTGTPGPLLDLGPHAVDLACWATGRTPVRVRSHAPKGRASSFDLELAGALAHIRLSHDAGWREVVRVANGASVAHVQHGGVVDRARRALARGPGPLVDSLRAQLEAAGRAARGEPADERLATAADGVRAMTVLDAAARAELRPGAWVDVESRG